MEVTCVDDAIPLSGLAFRLRDWGTVWLLQMILMYFAMYLGFSVISGTDAVDSSVQAPVHLKLTASHLKHAHIWASCPCALTLLGLPYPNTTRVQKHEDVNALGETIIQWGQDPWINFSVSAFSWVIPGGICTLLRRFPWVQALAARSSNFSSGPLPWLSFLPLSLFIQPQSCFLGSLPQTLSMSNSLSWALISGEYEVR